MDSLARLEVVAVFLFAFLMGMLLMEFKIVGKMAACQREKVAFETCAKLHGWEIE